MTDKIRVSTYLTAEEEYALRIMAAENRMSMSSYIAELIKEKIKKTDKVGQANKEQ